MPARSDVADVLTMLTLQALVCGGWHDSLWAWLGHGFRFACSHRVPWRGDITRHADIQPWKLLHVRLQTLMPVWQKKTSKHQLPALSAVHYTPSSTRAESLSAARGEVCTLCCRFFLPPIIFSAGLSVRKKSFFRNFVSIASLGILGTYVALTFIVLTLLLYRKCFGFLNMQVRHSSTPQLQQHLGHEAPVSKLQSLQLSTELCCLFACILPSSACIWLYAITTTIDKCAFSSNCALQQEMMRNTAVALHNIWDSQSLIV